MIVFEETVVQTRILSLLLSALLGILLGDSSLDIFELASEVILETFSAVS